MGGLTIAVNCVMPYIPRFETRERASRDVLFGQLSVFALCLPVQRLLRDLSAGECCRHGVTVAGYSPFIGCDRH